MKINDIITLKYNTLLKLCQKNTVHEYENTTGFKSFEDVDLLHDVILNFIIKNKNTEFSTIEIGFQKLKSEFLAERNYQKMDKPTRIKTCELKYLLDESTTI